MPNYVDYLILENTYIDTKFDLPEEWDSYTVYFQIDPLESNWYFMKWSSWIENKTWRTNDSWWDCFYRGSHSAYPLTFSSDFNTVWERWGVNEEDQPIWSWWWTNSIWWNYSEEDRLAEFDPAKYHNNYGQPITWWRLIIGDRDITGERKVWEIKMEVDWNLVFDLKPCLSQDWVPYFYDIVRNIFVYPDWYSLSKSMIKTVVMTWYRQTLPIFDGIQKNKISNRIIETNEYLDWYASKYDEICLSADEDNIEWIMVSDYTEDKQINEWWVADWIELKPRWTLVLPRNKQITALNKPIVKWHRWDLLRIVVR